LIVSVLVAVSGLALALAASAQSGNRDYRTEVQNAEAALKRETPRLYDPADRNSLSLRIDQLKEMAADLETLQSRLNAPNFDLDSATSAVDAAHVNAVALRQQASQTDTWAGDRLRQLEQSQYDICGQMDGTINANKCIFKCSDHMEVCQQKSAAFDRAVEGITQTAAEVRRKAMESGQAATAAETKESELQGVLDRLQAVIEDQKKALAIKSRAIGPAIQAFYSKLESARKTPLAVDTDTPAWKLLMGQNNYLNGHGKDASVFPHDCFEGRKCSDFPTNADGSLVVPPTPSAVRASSTTASGQQNQAEIRELVTQFNALRQEVIANPQNKEKVAQYARTLTVLEAAQKKAVDSHYSFAEVPIPSN
jgi:hypothetical protein